MKKSAVAFIIASVSLLLLLEKPAAAAGMSAGVMAWGAWWDPFFKKDISQTTTYFPMFAKTLKNSFTMNPTFLGGPVISFKFNEKIMWSNVLVVGKYQTRAAQTILNGNMVNNFLGSLNYQYLPSRQQTIKYDLDSTLNFTLTSFLKIFCGFKYQRYEFEKVSIMPFNWGSMDGFVLNNPKYTFNGIGMGLGLSFNIHLVENLFLIVNASALGQYPMIKIRKNASHNFYYQHYIPFPYTTMMIPLSGEQGIDSYYQLGGNITMSLAYYISKISLTLSLGGRYQYLKMLGADNPNADANFKGEVDHFYGVTFSAIYSFDFSKKESGQS